MPHADEDMGRYVSEWFAAADAFLLGRKTYEIFAVHWPQVTDENDPVATRLNRLPKYVASNTVPKLEWEHSTLLEADVVGAVAKLKVEPSTGVVVSSYRPAGRPEYGSFPDNYDREKSRIFGDRAGTHAADR